MSRSRQKGMVSVGGVTYRIERVAARTYSAVRVSDDVNVGTFKTGKELRVFPQDFDAHLLETIARMAVKTAKTSWAFHAPPTPVPAPAQPEAEKASNGGEPPVSSRRGWAPA